jgi:hypothetical protein
LLAQVDTGREGIVPARAPDTMTVADVLEIVRTQPASAGDQRRASNEPVEKILADLDLAVRKSPANRPFSELVEKPKAAMP